MRRLLLACALLIAGGAHAITFIENDYAAAVSRARAKDMPIFVEAWAPW